MFVVCHLPFQVILKIFDKIKLLGVPLSMETKLPPTLDMDRRTPFWNEMERLKGSIMLDLSSRLELEFDGRRLSDGNTLELFLERECERQKDMDVPLRMSEGEAGAVFALHQALAGALAFYDKLIPPADGIISEEDICLQHNQAVERIWAQFERKVGVFRCFRRNFNSVHHSLSGRLLQRFQNNINLIRFLHETAQQGIESRIVLGQERGFPGCGFSYGLGEDTYHR